MNTLTPIEFKNQRILITKQLAEVYGTSEDNIKVNFNNHKANFNEGVHFYYLTGEELRAFKNQVNNVYLVPKNTSKLYLWTERGANRHCKILDTKEAWKQFDNLEETYFRVKEQKSQLNNPMTPELVQSMIVASAQAIGCVIAPVIDEIKNEIADMRITMGQQAETYQVQLNETLELATINTKKVNTLSRALRTKLSKICNRRITGQSGEYLYVRRKLFKKYQVGRWEEITFSEFNSVFADIDSLENIMDEI